MTKAQLELLISDAPDDAIVYVTSGGVKPCPKFLGMSTNIWVSVDDTSITIEFEPVPFKAWEPPAGATR